MIWEIWMEGFRLSGEGEEAQAYMVGRAEADTFQEAVLKWYAEHPSPNFNPDTLSDWGCRLYPTETEARRAFG